MIAQPLTLDDAYAQALLNSADASPLSGAPYLLIDTRGDTQDASRVAAWLRTQPVPVIGIGEDGAIGQACDALVADAQAAAPLLATIERCPIASAVFVRLLRAIEPLEIESALIAESLAYATLQAGPEFARWLEANRAPQPAQPTDTGPAVIVAREDDVLTLELNRASNRNAMSVEMRDALVEALRLAVCDDSIRSIRISGRGKCFSTGGDLTEFGTAPDPATAHLVRTLALPGRELARCATRAQLRVHGACIGSGIEFPAFAGHISAREDAWFQLPELGFGLIPGAGGCVSLSRRIGRRRTAWLVLSGRRIDARTALDWGLVDAIEPDRR